MAFSWFKLRSTLKYGKLNHKIIFDLLIAFGHSYDYFSVLDFGNRYQTHHLLCTIYCDELRVAARVDSWVAFAAQQGKKH